ncbi:MAG: hypothetical protein AB2665_06870 [Candidatus Thiodiazotropha sp.]
MVCLEGGTHFLVLNRHDAQSKYLVQAYRGFNDALSSLKSNQRISPIFPIAGAPPPSLAIKSKSYLIFCGPIYPGLLDFPSSINLYLTLGTFNVLAWCKNNHDAQVIKSFVCESQIKGEIWEVSNGEIKKIEQLGDEEADLPESSKEIIHVTQELRTTAREYCLLIAKARGKACLYWPKHEKNFHDFDIGFREILIKEKDDLGRLTDLVITNAAISHFISQAYYGISPIVITESGYSINSLLGIGLASQALSSVRDFVSNVFTDTGFLQRIKLLKYHPNNTDALYRLKASDQFFNQDYLYSEVVSEELENNPRGSILPTLTFFSGRDGFRSTRFSLSAPLEVISGANTYQWTLLTLTHEISHIFVAGVLGLFFPDPKDLSKMDRIAGLLTNKTQPTNLYQQAEQLLALGFVRLYQESVTNKPTMPPKENSCSAEDLKKYVIYGSANANEILTHTFDFLYFYNSDPELYVRSVWSSWAVVPDIETRIPEYVNRTMCALFSGNMEWPLQTTIDLFKSILNGLVDGHTGDEPEIIKRAYDYIVSNEEDCRTALNYRIPFVKFVRGILFSPTIAAQFTREERPDITSSEFRKETITNPLRFLEQHATDSKPQMLRSVWMLQHLAFSELE